MEVVYLEEQNIGYLLKAVANLIKLPKTKMWLDYDSKVDVLYLHFEEKPASTHNEMRDDGIILDYRDNLLVGLTVLEASQR
jgi:uncharacterized protein YuzE